MRHVLFSFGEHAADPVQEAMGDRLRQQPGVASVGRVHPTSSRLGLRRQWYAEVTDEAAAERLVAQLRELGEVETAELPPKRGLL